MEVRLLEFRNLCQVAASCPTERGFLSMVRLIGGIILCAATFSDLSKAFAKVCVVPVRVPSFGGLLPHRVMASAKYSQVNMPRADSCKIAHECSTFRFAGEKSSPPLLDAIYNMLRIAGTEVCGQGFLRRTIYVDLNTWR